VLIRGAPAPVGEAIPLAQYAIAIPQSPGAPDRQEIIDLAFAVPGMECLARVAGDVRRVRLTAERCSGWCGRCWTRWRTDLCAGGRSGRRVAAAAGGSR
jgi:hypothetical protein